RGLRRRDRGKQRGRACGRRAGDLALHGLLRGPADAEAARRRAGAAMSGRAKLLLGLGGAVALAILLGVTFGSGGKNNEYQPQNEFKLDPWLSIHVGSLDLSINKAVLYLVLACGATIATMVWIANRMEARPNRVQTAVEAAYSLMKDNIAGANM